MIVICPVNLINQWEDEIAKFKELSMTVLTNPNEVLSVDTGKYKFYILIRYNAKLS